MSKLGIFMAEGCEEIEGLSVVDILRRGQVEIDMIALTEEKEVTGSHGICFRTETNIAEAELDSYDGIVLPGGMPGTKHLAANETVCAIIKKYAGEGKMVAAICAAPSVLGENGILKGKRACCHPGLEKSLEGAEVVFDPVVRDGNVITSRGMGTATLFGLEVLRYFTDDDTVSKVMTGLAMPA